MAKKKTKVKSKAKPKNKHESILEKKSRTGPMLVHDWNNAFKLWAERNIDYPRKLKYTFAQLGRDIGIKPETVRRRAYKYKWVDELLHMRYELDNPPRKIKVNGNQTKAIEILQHNNVNKELFVRQRHATMGRNLQHIAYAKIKNLKPKDISVKDAIKMLDLGLAQERIALGITSGDMPEEAGATEEFNLADVEKVMGEIIPLLKDKDGVYEAKEDVIDVEIESSDNSKSN